MALTFLDFETTYQVTPDGKKDPSPYHPKNQLVSVAYTTFSFDTMLDNIIKKHAILSSEIDFLVFYHISSGVGVNNTIKENKQQLQKVLDNTTELICHHTKFDLAWLWESGFIYNGKIDCTMNRQYILNRGVKKSLSLEGLGEQYSLVSIKQSGLLQEYLDANISMEYIPLSVLEPYNRGDIATLAELWIEQQKEFIKEENKGLIPTLQMMNEYTKVLITMESNGIKIDKTALKLVKSEYSKEQQQLKLSVNKMVANVMGDTPVNLDSPEQLSQLIYSRRVIDKPEWKRIFNIGTVLKGSTIKQKYRTKMNTKEFVSHVKTGTEPIFRTSASQCKTCKGMGNFSRTKSDGTPYKKPRKCPDCEGVGVVYKRIGEIAGFKKIPRGSFEAAAGGFRTNSETLNFLAESTLGPEKGFFVGVARLNAIDTYLNTFVPGIENNIGEDSILHQQYMQCVAATGRLVSRSPNSQNWPRGATFPIKKVFVSRFENGKLTKADQGQLEYRMAVFLADDKAGREDIKNNVDAHQLTADMIGCIRQDAKAHTFKPLYGGTTGTEKEQSYYKSFLNKHKDIAKWHERLQDEAISTKKIVLPSGREYAFPTARRTKWGSTNATQIKNYPVQGFATADVVPVWLIELWYLWQEYKPMSLICLTTHDDVVIDTHLDELVLVKDLILAAHNQIPEALMRRYGIKLDIPLMVEIEQGPNLLELETIVKQEVG